MNIVPHHTVFVVDDDASVRKSLGRLLKSAGHPAEVFASAAEFLQRAPGVGVGCLVLDVQMPGPSGIDLQQALAEKQCYLPIIFMTGYGDIPTSVRAMKAGAADFLQKPVNAHVLLNAVDQAVARCRRDFETRTELAIIRRRLATLTPRERQVFCHVIAGKPNKQIATDLGAAEKTIKIHRGRVMRKMQASSLADLVRIAGKAGLGSQGAGSSKQ